MANQGEMLPNHAVHANVQARLFDAAGALMLLGVAAVSTAFNNDTDADAWQIFIAAIGLLAWLLGVSLLPLVPFLARRFPQADHFAGAAIAGASAVLGWFFVPWN